MIDKLLQIKFFGLQKGEKLCQAENEKTLRVKIRSDSNDLLQNSNLRQEKNYIPKEYQWFEDYKPKVQSALSIMDEKNEVGLGAEYAICLEMKQREERQIKECISILDALNVLENGPMTLGLQKEVRKIVFVEKLRLNECFFSIILLCNVNVIIKPQLI